MVHALGFTLLAILGVIGTLQEVTSHGGHPLSRIAVHKAELAIDELAYVKASPTILGLKVRFTTFTEFNSVLSMPLMLSLSFTLIKLIVLRLKISLSSFHYG